MRVAGDFHAWLIVCWCPPRRTHTFPAICGAWRNSRNAMSVARGSRDKSGQATCSLGDRARPYEVKFQSPADQALDNLPLHIAVEPFLSAVEARYAGKADRVEVMDYFGRDEIRGPFARRALNFWRRVCRANHPASRRSLSSSQRTWWKKYTRLAGETAYRGGLPIHLLREVENYVSDHLAECPSNAWSNWRN